jgi:Spy/CpxP family protein refolding chaperone
MNASKGILIFISLLFLTTTVFAQTDLDDKMEKFQSQKIAFITNKLKLTPKEAQVFWPVYNDYDARKQEINKSRLKAVVRFQIEGEGLTEKEASELADKYINLQKQDALLAEDFNTKFKAILPATKLLKLYQAELQFKRELLKQLKQGKSEHKRIND